MQVNGDQFLKNIEKEQAKNQPTPPPHSQEEMNGYYNNFNEYPSTNSELDDIRLQETKNNKQKYILFGLSLVLLFLITIVTLRLLSSDNENKNNFTDNNLIDEKTYTFAQKDTTKTQNNLNIDEIEQAQDNLNQQKQDIVPKQQPKQSDLFELESKENENSIKQTEVVNETAKPFTPDVIEEIKIKNVATKQEKPKTNTKPIPDIKGFYIQVGAFTKAPDEKLLKKISANNYNYIVHKMDVKGTMYNKVLIGKYNSRAEAQKEIPTIKSLFNKYAYILKVDR
jgi:DedD protein